MDALARLLAFKKIPAALARRRSATPKKYSWRERARRALLISHRKQNNQINRSRVNY